MNWWLVSHSNSRLATSFVLKVTRRCAWHPACILNNVQSCTMFMYLRKKRIDDWYRTQESTCYIVRSLCDWTSRMPPGMHPKQRSIMHNLIASLFWMMFFITFKCRQFTSVVLIVSRHQWWPCMSSSHRTCTNRCSFGPRFAMLNRNNSKVILKVMEPFWLHLARMYLDRCLSLAQQEVLRRQTRVYDYQRLNLRILTTFIGIVTHHK